MSALVLNSNVNEYKEEILTMKKEEDHEGGLVVVATSSAENGDLMVESRSDAELEELVRTRLMRASVEAQDPSSKLETKGTMKNKAVPERHHAENGIKSSTELEELTMREFVQGKDPSSKEVDDPTIRRFLHARDSDIEQASAMFLKYLKWRRDFVPNGSVSASEVQNQIAQNKMFLQGSDKKGRPISVVLGNRHFQDKKGGLKEFKRYVVYGLDKVCARIPPGEEKFVAIGDLEGWGYSNSDIRGYLGELSILQEYYPERLGKMFIVHAPLIFMRIWKIVSPLIDNKTKKKIVFVENKMLKSTLLEEIDESQLPEIYGGRLPLVPI